MPPGRPRKNRYEIHSEFVSTSEFVHDLLVKELGAKLVPDSDKTVPQQWAPPRLTDQEIKELMGLFDEYASAGIPLGEVSLTNKIEDGTYIAALVSGELQPPKEEGWNPQVEMKYVIVSNADGSPSKFRGKIHTEWFGLPNTADLKSDDEDTKKKAWGFLERLMQRMYQIGIEEPQKSGVPEINKFKGTKYIMQLNTPLDNNPKGRTYIQFGLKPYGENAKANGPSPFDEE